MSHFVFPELLTIWEIQNLKLGAVENKKISKEYLQNKYFVSLRRIFW